jgi:hypothetical protein
MQRRQFLAASIAASTLAVAGEATAQSSEQKSREYYQLRRYNLKNGPELKLTEDFFRDALIPAAKRIGLGPVGAFRLEFGEQTPAFYLLIPGNSIASVAELDLRLIDDKEFLRAAQPFWNATANAPAFQRVEISLMAAFQGWPKLIPPSESGLTGKRILQLRTYESPSNAEHVRKVEMFHSGEFGIFQKAGCRPVFFGDVLAGPRLPKLTYMLSFKDITELENRWNIFENDPAWLKLKSDPRFSFDQIVTNISNLVLTPLGCSEI